MIEEELEQRLDELRDRMNTAAGRDKLRKLAVLRGACYVVAAIVFIVTMFARDFTGHPVEASILGLLFAAVAFCVASFIAWIIKRIWIR
jgi:hypothetical protein